MMCRDCLDEQREPREEEEEQQEQQRRRDKTRSKEEGVREKGLVVGKKARWQGR